MFSKQVSICLTTYNGGKFLNEQIDSIIGQTYHDWCVLIRDDGSTDRTIEIVNDYCARMPECFSIVEIASKNIGPCRSFGRLLSLTDSPYIMFCDQDDVWLPNKIELTLKKMKECEGNFIDKPLLVHSDLIVVDSNLKKIAQSMWSCQKLFPQIGDDVKKLMAQNIVTGCAMMINRKAKELSIPIPQEAVMHDWWIAINVAKYGKIISIPNQLTYYRQHSGNKIGAYKECLLRLLCKLKDVPKTIKDHYKMIKKFDPQICYSSILLRKLIIKFAQLLK